MPSPAIGRAHPAARAVDGVVLAVRQHAAILVFLAAIFVARIFLADWNSYWSDELLSIAIYGAWNDSLLEMVRHLAQGSIHPPLYQALLYLWMGVFGSTEIATRALSDLFMTVAALFLYLTIAPRFGRLVAFFGAAGFSLLYWPMYYALEARSYAFTTMLVAISTWALLRFLTRLRAEGCWRGAGQLLNLAVLTGANVGLMLTHYYNAFWITAQGLFVVVVMILEHRQLRWPLGIGLLGLLGLVPVAAFFAIWGRVFVNQWTTTADTFIVDGDSAAMNPVQLLLGTVVGSNIRLPGVGIAVIGLLIAAVVIRSVVGLLRDRSGGPDRGTSRDRDRHWLVVGFAAWTVLPLVVTWAAFTVAGVERYQARYFIFSIPPLVPLLIIAIAWTVGLLVAHRRRATAITTVLSILALVVVVIPGGLGAATARKHDWRGIIGGVVNIVTQDEAHRYTIIETGYGDESRARYYFERSGSGLASDILVRRWEEQNNDFTRLDPQLPTAADSDYLVVMMLHLKSEDLPHLQAHLAERYTERYRQVGRDGRGYIVYEVAGAAEAAPEDVSAESVATADVTSGDPG